MINKNIKKLRIARGLTQTDLANALWVSKQCVSNWESDYSQPSIDMIIKLAEYFKVTTDHLLGLDDGIRIDVTGLSETEAAHIRVLIEDLLQR